MPLFTDSRYANGEFYKAYDPRNGNYQPAVLRAFPQTSADFYYYVWTDKDRIDVVAHRLLGNSDFWTKIMDYNPEILDALSIAVGTNLRIPRD